MLVQVATENDLTLRLLKQPGQPCELFLVQQLTDRIDRNAFWIEIVNVIIERIGELVIELFVEPRTEHLLERGDEQFVYVLVQNDEVRSNAGLA